MTLDAVKKEVRKYFYMEDDTVIDAALAVIIANRLQIGNPVWLVLIGASSGGKSQLLKPLANTDTGYMHSLDDVTENTFLSGANLGKGRDASLLTRIGKVGMLVISDLTVLFSRNKDSRNAILSQFRMLYDGEMIKTVGNMDKPLVWKGYLGIIAGSTPSIYRHFEDVSDMGERFQYWRLKWYDERKAARVALSRDLTGNELDEHLAEVLGEYIKEMVIANKDTETHDLLTPEQTEEIIGIAVFSEKIRTTITMDWQKKEVERLPVSAFPMRTALQLNSIAKAIALMRGRPLDNDDMQIIRWLGWSLANEERRAVLTALANSEDSMSSQAVGDVIGLSTNTAKTTLQGLAALGVVDRTGTGSDLHWKLKYEYAKRTLDVCDTLVTEDSKEHMDIDEMVANSGF